MWSASLFANSTPAPVLGRSPGSPMYGVNFDNISAVAAKTTALQSLAKFPTASVVFDTGQSASSYLSALTSWRSSAFIMGRLIDSSYMPSYTAASAGLWTQQYLFALKSVVDLWEIGNEVNGSWLSTGDGSDVMPKILAQFNP